MRVWPTSRRPIRRLGQRIGRGPEAERLAAAIESDIEAIRKQVAGRPRPKTVILFDREPGGLRGMYASAGLGFMHDMLEVAGGEDAFDDMRRQSVQLSAEMLLARAPEVIVEVQTSEGWPPERITRELAVWKTLPALPAVRTGRVHIVADDRLSIPGPRVAEGIRLLARVLHPAAFGSKTSGFVSSISTVSNRSTTKTTSGFVQQHLDCEQSIDNEKDLAFRKQDVDWSNRSTTKTTSGFVSSISTVSNRSTTKPEVFTR